MLVSVQHQVVVSVVCTCLSSAVSTSKFPVRCAIIDREKTLAVKGQKAAVDAAAPPPARTAAKPRNHRRWSAGFTCAASPMMMTLTTDRPTGRRANQRYRQLKCARSSLFVVGANSTNKRPFRNIYYLQPWPPPRLLIFDSIVVKARVGFLPESY